MTERVRVLVYGGLGTSACTFHRRSVYVPHLAGLGVDLVPWTPPLVHPPSYSGRWFDALRDGVAEVDLSGLGEAQVVVFSRWANTRCDCTVCGAPCDTPDGLAVHARTLGHDTLGWDPLLRPTVSGLLGDRRLRARCAIVYDVDDDLFHQPEWVGHTVGLRREMDLVELFVRAADLVTVSTPVLQEAMRALTPRMHVVRNAVEPGHYPPPPGGSDSAEKPRILFYGADVRRRDYAVCKAAVDRSIRSHSGCRRVWLGSDSPAVRSLVDEAHPPVDAGPPFSAALAALRPQIGLAPLDPSAFARAKSELHWLEYSLVGAATVASRFPQPGPYDLIRDGQDGFLVGNDKEWRRALGELIGSSTLRADMAGRARERILAEYQVSSRAMEWAAVYRWAAAHPGIGAQV